MLGYDGFHVWGAAIAQLNCVAVEYFCIFMLRRKVLVYKGKKMFPDVRGYLFAERGIEPNYIAATLTGLMVFWFGLVFDLFIEPAVF